MMEKRKHEWLRATAHLEEETPTDLRFPVYGQLHALNLHAQSLVDVLGEIGKRLSPNGDRTLHYQYLVQFLRACVTSDLLDHMAGIEQTEEWIFENLGREQKKKQGDPDDVYIDVRERETERLRLGLSPKVRFLNEEAEILDRAPEPKGNIARRKPAGSNRRSAGTPNG
jgi:hypothetical protein